MIVPKKKINTLKFLNVYIAIVAIYYCELPLCYWKRNVKFGHVTGRLWHVPALRLTIPYLEPALGG